MIIRNSHKDFFGADIHPGGMQSHNRHAPISFLSSASHISSFIGGNGPGSKDKQTPNRDQRPQEPSSSLTCTQPRTHAYRRTLEAPLETSGRSCRFLRSLFSSPLSRLLLLLFSCPLFQPTLPPSTGLVPSFFFIINFIIFDFFLKCL